MKAPGSYEAQEGLGLAAGAWGCGDDFLPTDGCKSHLFPFRGQNISIENKTAILIFPLRVVFAFKAQKAGFAGRVLQSVQSALLLLMLPTKGKN